METFFSHHFMSSYSHSLKPSLENLENRTMAAADSTIVLNTFPIPETIRIAVAQGFIKILEGREHNRLTENIRLLETAIADAEKQYAAAKTELDNMTRKTLYDRSPFNAELTLPPPYDARYDAYRRAMEDHSHALRQMLDSSARILASEGQGDMAYAKSLRDQTQRFIDSHFVLIRGMEQNETAGSYLRSLGMRISRSLEEYLLTVKNILKEQNQKQFEVQTVQATIIHTKCELDTMVARLKNELDLRPQAASLDGTTTEEVNDIDTTLETLFTEALDHDFIIDESLATFSELLTSIAEDVATHGNERTVAITELTDSFNTSTLFENFTILDEEETTQLHEQKALLLAARTETVIRQLTTKKMEELKGSIALESKQMPALLRQRTELERRAATGDADSIKQQSRVDAAQATYDRTAQQISLYRQELQSIQGIGRLKIRLRYLENELRALGQILGNSEQRLAVERLELNRLKNEKEKILSAFNPLHNLISACEDHVRGQTALYLAYAAFANIDETTALADLSAIINQALYEGREAIPRVQPSIDVIKTDTWQGQPQAYLLRSAVTEVKEGKAPTLTKAGGSISAIIRLTNKGNRAGPIIVQIRGVSDLTPHAPNQHVLTLHLEPGQSQDIFAAVSIPPGKDAPGSVVILASTPDEADIPREIQIKAPTVKTNYEQGKGAVLHNASVILESPGGTGTPAQRLQKYLAANNNHAALIAEDIRTGKSQLSVSTAEAILAAHKQNQKLAEEQQRKMAEALMEGGDDKNLVTEQTAKNLLTSIQRGLREIAENNEVNDVDFFEMLNEEGKLLVLKNISEHLDLDAITLVASTGTTEKIYRTFAQALSEAWKRAQMKLQPKHFISNSIEVITRKANITIKPDTLKNIKKGMPVFAKDINEIEEKLEKANVATSENTMIMMIYGSNQFPNQLLPTQDEYPGFDGLYNQLKENYPEVWPATPGLNPFAGSLAYVIGPSPSETQQNIQKFISDRLETNRNIKNIVLIGYSWGGGEVFDISKWLSSAQPNATLAAAVYVDAVNDETASAENRMPIGTKAMLNIYQSQSHVGEAFLNGGEIKNNDNISLIQIDMDCNNINSKVCENKETHASIDNDKIVLSRITSFISNNILSK